MRTITSSVAQQLKKVAQWARRTISIIPILKTCIPYSERLTYLQNLHTRKIVSLNNKCSHPKEFCALLEKIVKLETNEETKKVIHRIIHDILDNTLTQSRLGHYQLSLILNENLGDTLTKTILTQMNQSALSASSSTIPNTKFNQTQEDFQYHQEMETLISVTQNPKTTPKRDKPITNTHIGDSFIRMIILDKTENRLQKHAALTSVQTALAEIHHTLKSLSNLSHSQRWIKYRVKILKQDLETKALPAVSNNARNSLPDSVFDYALDSNGTVVLSEMNLIKGSKKNWDETLKFCNNLSPFPTQFFIDASRSNVVLKDMTQNYVECFSNDIGSQTLTQEAYEKFFDDTHVVGTLSKITSQVFASYMMFIDQSRLQQSTPFSFITGKSNPTCTITKTKNGLFTIEYKEKKIFPTIISLNTDAIYPLKDAVYTIKSTCTFDPNALSNGKLLASEPTVKITYTPSPDDTSPPND